MASIGVAISKCRKEKGWSQQALGNKFMPQKTASEISRWERNIVKPSARHIVDLIDILGEEFSKYISSSRQTSQAMSACCK